MATIPYINLALEHQEAGAELEDAVRAVRRSAEFILGAQVAEFETQLAAFHNLPYAVGVGSGLDALVLTLLALGIGKGDEVITVPNSFIATAAAIVHAGARPVFVDVDKCFTMNPDQLPRALTSKTRALIPVHLYGRPVPMKAIVECAAAAGVPVIEDCAQAIGASLNGQMVGTFGSAGCYSFHPIKNLGACGDAGAVVTSDASLASSLRLLRNHGLQDRDTCVRWGYNSRLDTLQASILKNKLGRLQLETERRRRVAARYFERLQSLPLILPKERAGEYCVWHAFVIQTSQRDKLRGYLAAVGIETKIHYPVPIHLQPAARDLGYGSGSFPVCEKQAETILSLPVRGSLKDEEVDTICDAMIEFFQNEL